VEKTVRVFFLHIKCNTGIKIICSIWYLITRRSWLSRIDAECQSIGTVDICIVESSQTRLTCLPSISLAKQLIPAGRSWLSRIADCQNLGTVWIYAGLESSQTWCDMIVINNLFYFQCHNSLLNIIHRFLLQQDSRSQDMPALNQSPNTNHQKETI
jgi:hypothetical protein